MKLKENSKIGTTTLIKRKGKDAKGQWIWVVLCGCGKTFEMCYNSLFYAWRRGYLNCGCDYVMGHTVNIKKDPKKYKEFLEKKKQKEKKAKLKNKPFFCPIRDKLNKDFFQDPKRAKCYSNKFCTEKPCITFAYIDAKYTNYRGINNASIK